MGESFVECLICGCKQKTISRHLKVSHNMTVEEYKEIYKAPVICEELKNKKSNEMTKRNLENWKSEEYRTKKIDDVKKQWEDNEFRNYMKSKLSVEMTERWKDETFKETNSKRLSNLASNNWKSDEYRIKQAESRTKFYNKHPEYKISCSNRFQKAMKKAWKDPEFRASQLLLLEKARDSANFSMSSIHKKVNEFLDSIGVIFEVEKSFSGMRVDIYIPEGNLVIEVNGEYWHGKHNIPIEEMTIYQKEGYLRDLRRLDYFGDDKVLFLWETEIISDDYKSKLIDFLIRNQVRFNDRLPILSGKGS